MAEYSVKIAGASWELTPKDRVKFKDTGDATKLDTIVTEKTPLKGFVPTGYVILLVHNDRSSNPDYNQYIIIDNNGKKYVTGSDSFFNSFMNIWTELDEEDFSICIYKKESKNYKGKYFLSCSLE